MCQFGIACCQIGIDEGDDFLDRNTTGRGHIFDAGRPFHHHRGDAEMFGIFALGLRPFFQDVFAINSRTRQQAT